MIAQFPITVLYTQVVVHLADVSRPGLLWDDDHVAQGFAWSDGIVSFGVPDHDGQCVIEVDVADNAQVGADCLWAVQVPFDVGTTPLKVGTIGILHDVEVPEGRYNLNFAAYPAQESDNQAFRLKLIFVPAAVPDFTILKQGDELTTSTVLKRTARHG